MNLVLQQAIYCRALSGSVYFSESALWFFMAHNKGTV